MNLFSDLFKTENVKKAMILFAVIIANIMVAIEAAFGVVISDVVIQGDLAVDNNRALWLLGIFLTGAAASAPAIPALRSRFTDKEYFAYAVIFFGIGSFISCIVTNYYLLLFVRFFLGFAGGMIQGISQPILNRITEERYKKFLYGIGNHITMLCFGFASAISGKIIQDFHWRVQFFLDMILALISAGLFCYFFKEDQIKKDIAKVNIDRGSYFCFLGFLACFRIYFSQVKEPWNTLGWRSDFSFFFLIMMCLFFILMVKRYFTNHSTFLNFSLLKNKKFTLVVFVQGMMRAIIFGPQVLLSLLLINEYKYQYDKAGYTVCVFGFSVFISWVISVVVKSINRINPIKMICFGVSVVVFSCFLTHALTIQSQPGYIMFILILNGIGIGFSMNPLRLLMEQVVPSEDLAEANKLNLTIAQFCTAVSSSVLGSIVVMRQAYHGLIFSEQVDIYSGRFKNYIKAFNFSVKGNEVDPGYQKANGAKLYVIDQLEKQAKIASFDDSVWLLGFFILLGTLTILAWIYFFPGKKAKSQA